MVTSRNIILVLCVLSFRQERLRKSSSCGGAMSGQAGNNDDDDVFDDTRGKFVSRPSLKNIRSGVTKQMVKKYSGQTDTEHF